jgi:hypothetical protein
VRADMLLHNLEAIAADMARNNVDFSSSVGVGEEGLPVSNSVEGVLRNSGRGGSSEPGGASGRPSTGQLKEHVHDIQKRIQLAVTNHFANEVDTGPLTTTVEVASSKRNSPRQPADIYHLSTPATMYSTLVQTAKRAQVVESNVSDSKLYRLPGIAPASGESPMVINHFNSSAPSTGPFRATSLSSITGQQPVSARFQRALLDGSTSSVALRELTLVAERQQSPRSYPNVNRGGGVSSPRQIQAPPTPHTGGTTLTTPSNQGGYGSTTPLTHNHQHRQQQHQPSSTTAFAAIYPPPLSPRIQKRLASTGGRMHKNVGITSSPRRSRPSDAALQASLDALQCNLHVGSMPALDVGSVRAALGITHKTPRPPQPNPTTTDPKNM